MWSFFWGGLCLGVVLGGLVEQELCDIFVSRCLGFVFVGTGIVMRCDWVSGVG